MEDTRQQQARPAEAHLSPDRTLPIYPYAAACLPDLAAAAPCHAAAAEPPNPAASATVGSPTSTPCARTRRPRQGAAPATQQIRRGGRRPPPPPPPAGLRLAARPAGGEGKVEKQGGWAGGALGFALSLERDGTKRSDSLCPGQKIIIICYPCKKYNVMLIAWWTIISWKARRNILGLVLLAFLYTARSPLCP